MSTGIRNIGVRPPRPQAAPDRGYLRRLIVRMRGIRQVRAAIFTEAMRQLAESRAVR